MVNTVNELICMSVGRSEEREVLIPRGNERRGLLAIEDVPKSVPPPHVLSGIGFSEQAFFYTKY